jgi:beta-lactamase class A
MWSRRQFGFGCAAATFIGAPAVAASDPVLQLTALEHFIGGRIGVAAIDTGSGRRIAHRADGRFAMCSTFKWLLAAAVPARSEHGSIALDSRISYSAAELPSHSPLTRARLSEGFMSVEALCEAAVERSDNGAANLLLHHMGGPAAVTEYASSIGDPVTRLDRYELALNENLPCDPRDTTTPSASVADLRKVLLGDALAPESRARLVAWMKNCQTGFDRLRAGLPRGWMVADKTGTGTGTDATSAVNDIAVVWPPNRPPIVVASYISGSPRPIGRQSAAHAEIGRLVAASSG